MVIKFSDGVDLLSHHSGLRSNCFVAMEAVRWLMERLSDAITRAEAVKILQVCWDQHITGIILRCVAETSNRISDSTCLW